MSGHTALREQEAFSHGNVCLLTLYQLLTVDWIIHSTDGAGGILLCIIPQMPQTGKRILNRGDLQWVSLLTSNYYIFLFYLHINCIILLSSAKKQNKIFHQRKCFFNSTAKLVLCESVGAVWYKLSNIIYHFPVGLTSPNKPDSIKILRIAPCVGLTDDSPDD